MGIPVLYFGNSGCGKSFSLRNFEANEIGVFNVIAKPHPFRKKLRKVENATYEQIASGLQSKSLNTYVIDDSNYLMTFESFDTALETGYTKFTINAKHFSDMVRFVITNLPSDTIVYFMMHTDLGNDGILRAKTIGQMIDSQLCLEGLFTIALLGKAEDGKYGIITQSDGTTIAKSPYEMFPLEIDNDLKFVDDTIREYWDLPKRKVVQPTITNNKTTTNKENK